MLTGTESLLAAAMEGSIESEIAIACGATPIAPKCIDGLTLGIAKALIPHLVTNIQIPAGQTTTSAGATLPGPPGGPLPIVALPGSNSVPWIIL